MNLTEFRIKIRYFFRKNKKIIIMVISIWAIVIFVNYMLKNRVNNPKPTTTYEPHVSVMSQTSSTPKSMQEPIEKLIKSYVTACNEGDYEKAYNLLSDDCRNYEFDNSQEKFLNHVLTKIPSKKEFSIQDYSNLIVDSKKLYIYEVKYTEDLLATGLTNSEYMYTSEKMSFYRDDDGKIKMSVGSYIYFTPVQSISENEYLKIDIQNKLVKYETETYEVKFTNRSENTVVIADGYGKSEVQLQLNNEVRTMQNENNIVLLPGESETIKLVFPKYVDDGDSSNSLIFGSIRVMENYSGTMNVDENTIQNEIDNAVAKFSMNVVMTK